MVGESPGCSSLLLEEMCRWCFESGPTNIPIFQEKWLIHIVISHSLVFWVKFWLQIYTNFPYYILKFCILSVRGHWYTRRLILLCPYLWHTPKRTPSPDTSCSPGGPNERIRNERWKIIRTRQTCGWAVWEWLFPDRPTCKTNICFPVIQYQEVFIAMHH